MSKSKKNDNSLTVSMYRDYKKGIRLRGIKAQILIAGTACRNPSFIIGINYSGFYWKAEGNVDGYHFKRRESQFKTAEEALSNAKQNGIIPSGLSQQKD